MSTEAVPSISTSAIPDPSQVEQKLPKLSAAEFRAYNKQAVMMEYYHNRFRQTWTTLHKACETNTRPKNMSLSAFMSLALQFVHHLTIHHNIEETHIFPILGARMPEFSHSTTDNPAARAMVQQHELIHAGLDRLQAYLEECRGGERDFRLRGEGGMLEVLDSFGEVLWLHLDEEVRLLGAENMRLYWAKEEVQGWNF